MVAQANEVEKEELIFREIGSIYKKWIRRPNIERNIVKISASMGICEKNILPDTKKYRKWNLDNIFFCIDPKTIKNLNKEDKKAYDVALRRRQSCIDPCMSNL